MDAQTYWKNFNLGTELAVAGGFIYNALKTLDLMRNFYQEEEIFELLYNTSVGIERLEKITIILLEHDEATEQESFEKSLITHSHQELYKRIKQLKDCNLQNVHNDLLQLLSSFYKTMRYDRYNLSSVYNIAKERKAFINFIEKHLEIEINIEVPFDITPNNNRIKKFLGKIVGYLCKTFYKIIYEESNRLNIYTTEINPMSKAYKIFIHESFDFLEEEIIWNELLVFILNTHQTSGALEFVKGIEALDLEICELGDFIDLLKRKDSLLSVKDQIEFLYDEASVDLKNRLDMFDCLNSLSRC